ncbi:Gfo/Idh/MocA family oxidoreductase [Hamadaea sp. NPDC050747]|uniref:Gfo/Idh/MocA family protein n=1 Tax=Hamadaea sp. NPDC050747 TaxID=3155789 RepID=UPI0033CBD610
MTRAVGVIGLGAISPYFCAAIRDNPRWRLAAVCDRDPERCAPFVAQGVPAFGAYQDLLESELVEAVVVTLPNDLHPEVVRAALDRGLDVCCEKPLATDADEARRLAEAAVRRGRTLLTASHRRYNRHLVELANSLPPRAEITRVVSRYYEDITEHTGGETWYFDSRRCGGGCLMDNGPNAVDVVRRLLGELTVTGGTIAAERDGVEYRALIELATADGIPVEVDLDWAYRGQVKDVTVETADGRRLVADMLAGFDGLKGSLAHEYAAIMADFADRADQVAVPDDGPAVVSLIEDAYRLAGRSER